MGIRGAWSLLSKDPSRFGERWSLVPNGDTTECTVLFIDGPSMLYHVAVTDYSFEKPLSQNNHASGEIHSMICPDEIYRRATSFVSSILQSGGDAIEVHVVMDGLAPDSKMPTKISRLTKMAEICEKVAASGGKDNSSTQTVLHVFAECALTEAIIDMASLKHNINLHRPLHGEAEIFIAQWLTENSECGRNVVIFSDDTDFLVYPSCPGIVPFSTLQFQSQHGIMSVAGFQYLRSRFIASFLPGYDRGTEQVLTAVAALAGCDYGNCAQESMFHPARTFIVQSNISGLRKKARNDPSSSAALTAILRFVAHFVFKNDRGRQRPPSSKDGLDDDSWIFSLAETVLGAGKGQEQRVAHFIESLDEIHDTYFPVVKHDCRRRSVPESSLLWIHFARLVERGDLLCLPLIESWKEQSVNKAKEKRTPNLSGNMTLCNNLPFLTDASVDDLVAGGSIWMVPHFCVVRKRIYSILQASAPKNCFPSFTEYHRVGTKTNVRCSGREVLVQALDNYPESEYPSFSLEDRASCLYDLILWCALGLKGKIDQNLASSIPEEFTMLFISSLMLPSRTALLLFLTSTIPDELIAMIPSRREHAECTVSLDKNLISVSYWHAVLIVNAVCYTRNAAADGSEETLDASLKRLKGIEVHRVLAVETVNWIREQQAGVSDEAQEGDVTVSFFENLRRTSCHRHDIAAIIGRWEAEMTVLWKIRCNCYLVNKNIPL